MILKLCRTESTLSLFWRAIVGWLAEWAGSIAPQRLRYVTCGRHLDFRRKRGRGREWISYSQPTLVHCTYPERQGKGDRNRRTPSFEVDSSVRRGVLELAELRFTHSRNLYWDALSPGRKVSEVADERKEGVKWSSPSRPPPKFFFPPICRALFPRLLAASQPAKSVDKKLGAVRGYQCKSVKLRRWRLPLGTELEKQYKNILIY